MRKSLYIVLVLLVVCASRAYAETILLRTGARIQGRIVFQNEEVVIIRDAEGVRYQYTRSDIEAVLSDEEADALSNQEEETVSNEATSTKKASIVLEAGGGVAIDSHTAAGGAFGIDLLVGSHMIAGRHLFIGGGLGYHGLYFGHAKYHFLPIQVALRLPFIEAKHAPVFGASLGYGIALSKNYLGGLYAGMDVGYRCQLNPKTALAVVAFAQIQQATVQTVEIIDETEYMNKTGRVFFTPGIKLALFF